MAITDSLKRSLVIVALMTLHTVSSLPYNQESSTLSASSDSQLSEIMTTESSVITSGSDVITTSSNLLSSSGSDVVNATTENNSSLIEGSDFVRTTIEDVAVIPCPVFPVMKKHGQLHFQLKPDYCHITVGVVRKPGSNKQNPLLKTRNNYVHLPLAKIEHVPELHANHSQALTNSTATDVTGKHAMCPDYPIRNVGLIAVVDTVPGRCQIALGVRLKEAEPFTDGVKKRFSYVPVYEYLDRSIII